MIRTSRQRSTVLGALVLLTLCVSWLSVSAHARPRPAIPVRQIHGVVSGSALAASPVEGAAGIVAIRYQHARVCVDANDNGVCDAAEKAATTDDTGAFVLTGQAGRPLVVDVSADATVDGRRIGRHLVFRAAAAQLLGDSVVVSPLSTEVVRIMEADGVDFGTARQTLASRLDVPSSLIVDDPTQTGSATERAQLLRESVILTNRFALASTMVDRRDVSPIARSANPSVTRPLITIKEAEQTVMNLESIPRYDYLFIIMLENKATSSIAGSPFAPKINAYLRSGNQFTSYFATGNPSEPNRVALAAGDDFGIVDDAPWNCVPAGDDQDLPTDPLPAGMAPCTNATNHNIKDQPNLFTTMSAAGMNWRIYSESMNPGRDWRLDSAADETIQAPDHVYGAESPVGAIGSPGLMVRMPARLYATKHNASVNFQSVRGSAAFARNNRTLGGGQWDAALKAAPTTPLGWDVDQLGTDLASGDVGNLNFLEPDQCDDMHGVKAQGVAPSGEALQTASDCGGDAIVYRGDNYTDYLIKRIQASEVWRNTAKRTAIVIMFDEGKATTGFNACCGWNPSAGPSIAGQSLGPLVMGPGGRASVEPIAQYNQGNKGHGTSIFGVLTNQARAPKHVIDSDAYSHIAFVRTIQDMFGLADPGNDWSYMNRSKYTEHFIAANLERLPEYAESADPHFDAVRPMNHAYVIPAGYLQKSGFVTPPGPQRGPDANQLNPWALVLGASATTSKR